MKNPFPLFLLLCFPLFCMAQNALPREYFYDEAGNRIVRRVIPLKSPENNHQTPSESQKTQNLEYFVENLSKIEIKVFPNPATEVVTLEIVRWKELQKGIFKLYSLNGQLLKEQVVNSGSTTISLVGFTNGTYLLKVQINDKIENWKIIKQ